MKTAQQYYEEALEAHAYANEVSDGHVDLEDFMVSAMKQYAHEVTWQHLVELDRVMCDEYNLSTDPKIETP